MQRLPHGSTRDDPLFIDGRPPSRKREQETAAARAALLRLRSGPARFARLVLHIAPARELDVSRERAGRSDAARTQRSEHRRGHQAWVGRFFIDPY
jgi:hypothetical protein